MLAFVFGFLGLVGGNPLLVFIGIFIYLAATAESADVAMTETTRSLCVRDGMITVFETLGPGATLADAADCLIRTTQQEFPVVDAAGRPEGFLTRNTLFKALEQADRAGPVREVMQRDVPLVHPHERLDMALEKMRKTQAPAIGVIDAGGRLVAYITPENLGELMMIRRAKAR
jgi:stage IV sporulation protein FB